MFVVNEDTQLCVDVFHPVDITVMFSQSVYSVNENVAGLVKPTLVLSNLSSADVTVNIRDTENRATSECALIT